MKIKMIGKRLLLLAAEVVGLLICSAGAFAADAKIDTGDTAWVLACSALVMIMTPGLGLFYAGMVRRKNVLATIMQSFIMVGLVGVLWVVYGYSLAFGHDHWGIIGSLDWVFLRNVGLTPNPDYSATIPHQAFVIFQAMFAIITPALITGAFAERMRFKAFMIFSALWLTFVYCPIAHWVWGTGGWLKTYGALDFAGGIVVHISSGVAALCCALVLGVRKGYGRDEFTPHNLTMTLIGTGLLWFGWFGFNAGSALAANGIAVASFMATNTAGATAAMVWLFIEWWHRGKPTALGAATGAIAGLAAVTPASGYIGPVAAMAIGGVVSVICYLAIIIKGKLAYDDSLDVFGVHGVGGMWGVLATGLFATTAINAAGANGLFHGGGLLIKQLVAVLAVGAYSFGVTFILLKLIGVITPLRVEKEDEETGLDLSQHGEIGYNL
ncbi:MAG: ammonium transporter [Armatimonadetes bacterium]|nr:ammonium transporter [Armatimonadota bacterium]